MKTSLPDDLRADLALINGKVSTVDAEDFIAEAVATRGNRILVVGSNEEVARAIGEGTEVLDLEGLTVLPGLIDSHMHPGSYGVFLVRGVKCGPDIESMGELLSKDQGEGGLLPRGQLDPGLLPRRREARPLPDPARAR